MTERVEEDDLIGAKIVEVKKHTDENNNDFNAVIVEKEDGERISLLGNDVHAQDPVIQAWKGE